MDEIDRIQENEAAITESAIQIAIREAAKIPDGVQGDCTGCGNHSKRLVFGRCARCREGL